VAARIQDRLRKAITDAANLYHRLVLLVGNSGTGKTTLLQAMASELGAEVINLNLALSQQLLELITKQRSLHVSEILDQIIKINQQIVFLDNIEILFDKSLKQDPLRLLQTISRNRSVVASWNGAIKSGNLIYAEPSHPEYRIYHQVDTPLVRIGQAASMGEAEKT
jgi:dephospho-CoA kinase